MLLRSRRTQRERASARRASRAARSARRERRRAIASWCPRRSSCASPRRAAICARARSSCMRFILVLRFRLVFMEVVGSVSVALVRCCRVTASGRARAGPGGLRVLRGETYAGQERRSGRGAGARPPPDARPAASERSSGRSSWHFLVDSLGWLSSWLWWVVPVSGGDLVLPGPTAGPLAGDHRSLQEQLAAPHSPGLPPLERAGQTLG